ncbi:MAG: dihydroorotate dehydrogenase-like protein [Flammeovirgaceae bacterium]|nr:dihydroorotate dehydrogenase-like protein [Flammeovirgaceae bacterium]
MANLKTKYMGISLKNPVIVGASNLVQDVKNLQKIEEAGAAAIIYKSLFEEQIQLESLEMQNQLDTYQDWDPEHATLFPDLEHAGPAEYIMHLKDARAAVKIPLIASINAVYEDSWVEYAKKLEATGVNGLELNFYANNTDFLKAEKDIEAEQVNILKKVKAAVKIPVSVKLSPFYTNTLKHIVKLDRNGASAFILFNRLFQPDIDIQKEEHHFPYNFSSQNDNRLAIRYAGLLYGHIGGSICSNTGIHTGEDAIKTLLAGADTVQVVSALYKKGIGYLSTIIADIEKWMNTKGYKSIKDFQGKLSAKNDPSPFTYKRAQYVDILMKSENFETFHPKGNKEISWEDRW